MLRSVFTNKLFIFIVFSLINPKLILAKTSKLSIGNKAPKFKLNGYNKNFITKEQWSLDDFSGKWLILYFYPQDYTSGCTLEAKGFQQKLEDFDNLNASVVGISADNEKTHESFCTSEDLGYTLLSDKNGQISKLYDSWLEPYSKRNTFLINPEGIIKYKWISVRPIYHANEVLEELLMRKKNNA